jgi:hypothetical protein
MNLQNEVDELITLLDLDARHLRKSLAQLNELRALLIKRDDTAMAKLLECIQDESNSYKDHESLRQSLRKELAQTLGCTTDQLTLSRLESMLPAAMRAQLNYRRTELESLIAQLRREYVSTSLLLSEFARLNTLVLNGILSLGGPDTTTYDSTGAAKRQTDTAFVNLHL